LQRTFFMRPTLLIQYKDLDYNSFFIYIAQKKITTTSLSNVKNMKKLLSYLLLFSISLAFGQVYQPLQLNGFNRDVIVDGSSLNPIASAQVNTTIEGGHYAFVAANWPYNSGPGLPQTRIITDPTVSGLTFELNPYSGNNVLQLTPGTTSGDLILAAPVKAKKIYVLVCAANTPSTCALSMGLHFGNTWPGIVVTPNVSDWMSASDPAVISGFGRIDLNTNANDNPAGLPKLFRYEINITPPYDTMDITRLGFDNLCASDFIYNIFAATAELSCIGPNNASASNVTATGATLSWNGTASQGGYDYWLTTDTTIPDASQFPTGNVNGNSTNLILLPGKNYCFWVRGYCNGTPTAWISTCFSTPSTITVSHSGGNIETDRDLNPTVSSSTNCPGQLTVNVPMGYRITNVATSYRMTSANLASAADQHSLLACSTTGMTENMLFVGNPGFNSTNSYNRNNIHIADGAMGDVNFELRAWRISGGTGCSTFYNYVDSGSWNVTVTLEAILGTQEFNPGRLKIYPNPTQDMVTVSTDVTMQKVQVFNLLGQEVLQQDSVNAKEARCSLAGLTSGKYLLKITSENGVETKSILKN
jgi:hypothetical protein